MQKIKPRKNISPRQLFNKAEEVTKTMGTLTIPEDVAQYLSECAEIALEAKRRKQKVIISVPFMVVEKIDPKTLMVLGKETTFSAQVHGRKVQEKNTTLAQLWYANGFIVMHDDKGFTYNSDIKGFREIEKEVIKEKVIKIPEVVKSSKLDPEKAEKLKAKVLKWLKKHKYDENSFQDQIKIQAGLETLDYILGEIS